MKILNILCHRFNYNFMAFIAFMIVTMFLISNSISAREYNFPKKETLNLLYDKKYSEIDRVMNNVQQNYVNGVIDDEELLDAFRTFYSTDLRLKPRYHDWVTLYPLSYSANLAQGIYLKYLGLEARGDKFIKDTSQENLQNMAVYFKKAMRYLLESEKLNEKPILSYHHALGVSMYINDRNSNHWFLDIANKTDPNNFIVRQKYMFYLRPRWGGSLEEMNSFLDDCKTAGLSVNQMNRLKGIYVSEKGYQSGIKGDYEAAQNDYETSKILRPEDIKILKSISWTLVKQKKYQEAIVQLNKIIDAEPDDSFAFANRGVSYMNLKNYDKAWLDYLKAAELGDAFSQNQVGKMLWHGTYLEQDRNAAVEWFRSSASQGHADAKKNLEHALDQM